MSSFNLQEVIEDTCFSIFLYVGVKDVRFPESLTQQLFHDLYVEHNDIGELPVLRDLYNYFSSLDDDERAEATQNAKFYRVCISHAFSG